MNKKKDKVGEEEAVKNDELPAVDPIPPQIPLEANAEEYKNPASISKARRRLSVDGDEAYLDGVGEIDMDIEAPVNDHPEDDVFVGIFAGKSQKGYVPYNPHKVNQDWMLIKEDAATGTLVLGPFDGHGEHGHCISEVGSRLPLHA